jgi:hypothetical protein
MGQIEHSEFATILERIDSLSIRVDYVRSELTEKLTALRLEFYKDFNSRLVIVETALKSLEKDDEKQDKQLSDLLWKTFDIGTKMAGIAALVMWVLKT